MPRWPTATGDRSRLPIWAVSGQRGRARMWSRPYLQPLEQRYLPALFNGPVKEMNAAPAESEEKLAVLRVIRMPEDKSGRSDEVVKQYMAKRWSDKFLPQSAIFARAQLMSSSGLRAENTPTGTRSVRAGDGDAISRWTPYDSPVAAAQKEPSNRPSAARLLVKARKRGRWALPADLNLRDRVGATFLIRSYPG
ncbi:hypothetical protein KCP76_20145 [Salmonella enterica subsp. enterica serovar Weltevreden]|nr:hypothetical protein KCP76_20145 [Salmonella enterica subsp. enterica serovar Weltevreden]